MNVSKWKILVVDDEANNLKMMQQILGEKYKLIFATDGHKALTAVEKHDPDLILLDIMMPGMDGLEVCRRLKSGGETASIPVIFVSAMGETEDESEGFEAGAVDYIIKPISAPVVLARVATHLALYNQRLACQETVSLKIRELENSQKAAVHMLGEAGHHNDTDTGVHIWRMAAYSAAIAHAISWKHEQINLLELAAPMHDTGKIGIPDSILKKPGKLDSDEWVVMKTHSALGSQILHKSQTPLFQMAGEIAMFHHEKWDGSGYPNGLSGEAIPQSARIVAIADVFDALTMKRPYKDPWPIEKAFAEIKAGAGKHFDPALVEAFLKIENEIREIKDSWEQEEKTQEIQKSA